MYGLLKYTNDQLTISYPAWNPFTRSGDLDFTDNQKQARTAQIVATLTKLYSAERTSDKKNAAFFVTQPALPYITDADLDYVIHMAAAFVNLHGVNYVNAQKSVAEMVDAQFPPDIVEKTPQFKKVAQKLKALGFLFPPATLPYAIEYVCSTSRMHAPVDQLPDAWKIPGFALIQKVSSGAAVEVGIPAILSTAAGDVPMVSQAVMTLLNQKYPAVFTKLETAYEEVGKTAKELAAWFLRTAVCMLAAHHPDSIDDIIVDVQTKANLWSDSCERLAYATTCAAIDTGVDFGQYSQQNRDARGAAVKLLRDWEAFEARELKAGARRLLASSHAQSKASQSSPTTSVEPDRETLQTWSVDMLARWIEGPVASKPLDGKSIVQRAKQSAPQAKAQTQTQTSAHEKAPEAEADTDALTEDEVNLIANQGYSATASFLLGEINDLIGVAKQMGTDGNALQECADLMLDLQQLQNTPPSTQVDEKARLLLTRAESGIASLRGSIHKSKSLAQQQGQFRAKLMSALAKETLALGRRQGGQIAPPPQLKLEDWTWVVDEYHNRVLPGRRQLVVNGKPRELDVNEALVFYVTGSSQSNYAFDVTVHLWRRYPGRTGPAALPDTKSPLAPVNTNDWYDTYITCCVLHVPH
jgi:hypothetical protein